MSFKLFLIGVKPNLVARQVGLDKIAFVLLPAIKPAQINQFKFLIILNINKILKSIAAIMLFSVIMSESSVAENALIEEKEMNIHSPDKSLFLSLFKTFEGRLSYSVIFDGIQVIEPSPLGITVDNTDLGVGIKTISSPVIRVIKEEYAVSGNHTKAKNHANEAIIPIYRGENVSPWR